MSNNENNFGADTGAGVGFSEAVNNVERVVPTPAASYNYYNKGTETSPTQQQQYTTVDMQQGGSGYPAYGFSLASMLGRKAEPVYVKIHEDPEEVQRRNIISYVQLGISVLGMLLFLLFVGTILSKSAGGNSNHLLIEKCNVKFSDVYGCDEVKVQLERIVKYLKDPSEFKKFGAKMPRGYLLAGPPGVGKTMLAKAVAGESGVAFLTISGAEFDEMFVGVGAARVRNLFMDARNHQKAVIFIDEIDAIAGKRNGPGMENPASRQTINQLLVEMDGFKTGNSIVVLAATNSPESLDPAILRPGRFDKVFSLMPPDIKGRENLLKKLIGEIPVEKREDGELKNLDVRWLAKITVGYTGADLANLVNQAKLIASAEEKTIIITKEHFLKAKDFIDLGPEREEIDDPEENKRTAHHEAGHAIIGLINQSISEEFAVEYATIVPHGQALGLVTTAPQKDLKHMSLQMYKCQMDMFLGGFMGEALCYGDPSNADNYDKVSTGAASDFKNVNAIARGLVESGFGEKTGFVSMPQNPLYSSEEYKKNFEADVKKFIDESKARVKASLLKYRKAWEDLAEALIKKKTLNKAEINQIFNANKPDSS